MQNSAEQDPLSFLLELAKGGTPGTFKRFLIFTARRSYASAVLGVAILSARLSVCHTRAL